jgi:CheY-like chemotaxis protein
MQILINLLSNAIKFTEEGEVFLRVKSNKETDKDISIYFKVKDTGIGISEDRIDRLFKSFSQVDPSITRKYGGTGLGLAISQKLTEMMGGNIGVYSEKDMGTTFWFTVTLEKQIESQITYSDKCFFDLKDIDKEKIRILIAEDNIVNQRVALAILSKKGFKADAVSNGREVLKSLKKIPYNLILMDVQMPELDGIKTTFLIRNKEKETGMHIPIIAMTAHAFKEDMEKCFSAGMDDYITKPVNPSELFRAISKQITGLKIPENKISIPKDDKQIFDKKDFLKRVDGDDELAKELLEIYLKNASLLIENLKLAFQEGNLNKIKILSHTLKGSSANIGAKSVNFRVTEIENLVREGKLEDIGSAIKLLEKEDDDFKKLVMMQMEIQI